MATTEPGAAPAHIETVPTDERLVADILAGDLGRFELLMRRYNQRLFRAARAILGDPVEAEDVLQETYVRAFVHLASFEGRAALSTWLTRIAVHEAIARLHKKRKLESMSDEWNEETDARETEASPETELANRELAALVEAALDELPPPFRAVFVLRAVEGLSSAETAACLDIPEETVKTRLFRARARLRKRLEERTEAALPTVHRFLAERCDRVVSRVLTRLLSRENQV